MEFDRILAENKLKFETISIHWIKISIIFCQSIECVKYFETKCSDQSKQNSKRDSKLLHFNTQDFTVCTLKLALRCCNKKKPEILYKHFLRTISRLPSVLVFWLISWNQFVSKISCILIDWLQLLQQWHTSTSALRSVQMCLKRKLCELLPFVAV